MDLYGELEWRGLIYDATEGAREALAREKSTIYAGFDPTASSLHVGHLLPILGLARAQRAGHSPIALLGGGTGLIGDPSFKAAERSLLTIEQVEANVERIRPQLARFLDFDTAKAAARLINNADWLTRLGAIEFMRDVGKHFSVNAMMAKEAVKRRLEGEDGISYTEFSYPLLQSYDFLVLYDRFNCTLQIGGSDQWGNITAGMDLIRRVRSARVHGLVSPLLMTAAGTKFGKTEAGSVWLDAEQTTPYEFYQFWLNIDDRDAVKYLKYFTFLDASRIQALEAAGAREPEKRHPQRELAREVTTLVHGSEAVMQVESAADKIFRGNLSSMTPAELLQAFAQAPSAQFPYIEEGWPITEFLTANRITASKGEATRLIRGGGISVNDQRVTDEKVRLMPAAALHGRFFVVGRGKKDRFLVSLEGGPLS